MFTCGEDCRVIVWNLSTGAEISSWDIGTEKPSSLVYLNASNRLLVAGRQLYLWSIKNEELEQTFTGHPTNVTILKYILIKSKEYILSASKTDRVLNLWRLKAAKNKPNSFSYLMEDIAYSVACSVDTNGELKIAAVTRSGVLHLYVIDNLLKDDCAGKPLRPNVTIEIAVDTVQLVEPIPIITASLDFALENKKIQIAYGDRQRLYFELIEPVFSEKRQVLIRSDPKKSVNDTKKHTVTNLKTVTPLIETENVEYQTNVSTVTRKSQKTIEIPMETRLENLTFDSATGTKQARNIAQLLVQALHSHDINLLRTVFINKDEQVIRSTLQRLPPQYIGSLVDELTQLAQKKTAK